MAGSEYCYGGWQTFYEALYNKRNRGRSTSYFGCNNSFCEKWEEPLHIQGLHFEDAFSSASYWAKWIRANEQIDVLILCYHGGFERNLETGELLEAEDGENQGYRMCAEIEEVDIIISGHQHREISTKINGKSIVQPGSKGTCIAMIELEVVMDEQHTIQSIAHTPALIYSSENTIPQKSICRSSLLHLKNRSLVR